MILLAAVSALLVLCTGCGSEVDGGGKPGTTTPSTTTPTTPTPQTVKTAASLNYHVTGGIDGRNFTIDVKSDGKDTAKLSADQRQQVFSIVNTKEFQAVKLEKRDTPCCDFLTYDLTVTFSDGTTQEIVWFDGNDSPPPVTSVAAILNKALPY